MELADGNPLVFFALPILLILPLFAALFGLLPGGRLEVSRTVQVQATPDRVWPFVRDVPALHARHARAQDWSAIEEYALLSGDGESSGSLWCLRGTWRGAPYWAEIEMVRVEPESALSIRLRRDSLGTHLGLRDHLGTLSLEPAGPSHTKITWSLSARLRRPHLILARLTSSERLLARLFDHRLRPLKVEIEHAVRKEDALHAAADDGAAEDALPSPPAKSPVPPQTTA